MNNNFIYAAKLNGETCMPTIIPPLHIQFSAKNCRRYGCWEAGAVKA